MPGIEREAVSYILILHDLWLFMTCVRSTMVYANAAVLYVFVVFCFLKASPVWECLLIIYYLVNIT